MSGVRRERGCSVKRKHGRSVRREHGRSVRREHGCSVKRECEEGTSVWPFVQLLPLLEHSCGLKYDY